MSDQKKSKEQGRTTPDGDHDRIVMASRAPDGTPNQIDPEFIGDKDVAVEAAKQQLAQQKVSAVDTALRGVVDEDGADQGNAPDPAVAKLKKAHDAAAAAGEKQAESEVNKLHEGLGDK